MLRWTGLCVLFVIFATCFGITLNSNNTDDQTPDIADIIETPTLKDIQFQPVDVSELKEQLQHARNYYDFLRIFLAKKDLSNDMIDQIVNARTIQKILDSHSGSKKPRDYDGEEGDDDDETDDEDYADEDYGDEGDMIMDAEQARLDEELTAAMYHNTEMAESPFSECRVPQPEVIHVTDPESKNRLYLPECTIVHRCRNTSGCCGDTNRECAPLRIQVIERTFLVMHLFGQKTLPGRDLVERRVFINHTECTCKEKQGLQDCDKYKCPYPFSMRRKGIHCACDCQQSAHENNFLCKAYKDGVIALSEKDLACIKKDDCLKPECSFGELHVQSGYCPKHASEERRRHLHHLEPEKVKKKEKRKHVVEPVKKKNKLTHKKKHAVKPTKKTEIPAARIAEE